MDEKGTYRRAFPWRSIPYLAVASVRHVVLGRKAYAELLRSGLAHMVEFR